MMTEVINPMSSRLETRRDYDGLRQLIQLSAQSAFLLLAPLAAVLFIFGRDVLRLWVGAEYVSTYPLLVLLTLGTGCEATQACIQQMLFGMGKHKGLIAYRLGEAAVIVVFGSAMLKFFNLEAYASVIALTLVTTSVFLIPRHLCQMLGLSLSVYLKEACLKPCLLTLPFAAALWGLQFWIGARSWLGLLSLVAAGSLFHLAVLLCVMFRPWKKSGIPWVSLGVLDVIAERARPALWKVQVFTSSRLRSLANKSL
jgi:O-antigen/teichoic acid export membrane protein